MRFAWLRQHGIIEASADGNTTNRLILIVYNVIWWVPIILAFAGIIDYRTGFIAFATITAIRAGVNLYRNNILPPEQGAQALPIVQEALLNAQRHAAAQRITLQGERRGQEAIITVEDNGRGFEPSNWWQNSHDHFGLSVMHARAARVGGSLQIDSAPGQGTRVTLSLPLDGGEPTEPFAGVQQATAKTIDVQGLDS